MDVRSMGMAVAVAVLGAALGAWCAPGVARAQSATGDLDRGTFRPALDSRGFITANASEPLGGGELSFGLVTDWGATYDVDHVISPTLQGALGLHLGVDLELGASLPFRVVSVTDGAPGADAQGVAGVGLHAKVRVLDAARHGVGVAALVSVAALDGGVVPWLVVDRAFAGGALRAGVNVGVERRAARTQVPFAVALSLAVAPGTVDLIGEVYGHADGPVESVAGVKLYLARSSYLLLGGGVGLGDGADTRAFLGIVFEPRPGGRAGAGPGPDDDDDSGAQVAPPPPDRGDRADRDGDGLFDDVDACPDEPEDLDDFRDDDGCPDPDNDDDGIADLDDVCPNEPEDFDRVKDHDGCKDPDLARRTGGGITTLENVYFETGSAVLLPESHGVLDAVAGAMHNNPDIELLEIQGHTDERMSRAYNRRLSQARAQAVRTYLVDQGGVAAKRLRAKGYGEDVPIDQGHDEAAWSKNRRVEFIILK